MFSPKRYLGQDGLAQLVTAAILTASLWAGIMSVPAGAQQPGQQTFPSAEAATKALVAAVQADDQKTLLGILGPDGQDLISSGDPVEDKTDREDFLTKYREMHRLVNEPDGTTTLYIGAENWPTPLPLVNKNGSWYFDTAAGKQEVLYRRVGEDELSVIQVCEGLVDAEKEYYAAPHDGNPSRQYAQRLFSDPGKQNGLYWQAVSGQPESPIGPLVASATAEGYKPGSGRPEPFHGYYFRILTSQGPHAPGGAKSYVTGRKMTGGFAFLAYPAQYRSSGVMTFMVGQNGVVYEKDLGPDTAETAKKIAGFDLDSTWRKAD